MDRNDKVFYVLIKSLPYFIRNRYYVISSKVWVSYLRTNEDINNGPAKKITDRKRLWLYPAARNKGFTLVDNDNVLVLG